MVGLVDAEMSAAVASNALDQSQAIERRIRAMSKDATATVTVFAAQVAANKALIEEWLVDFGVESEWDEGGTRVRIKQPGGEWGEYSDDLIGPQGPVGPMRTISVGSVTHNPGATPGVTASQNANDPNDIVLDFVFRDGIDSGAHPDTLAAAAAAVAAAETTTADKAQTLIYKNAAAASEAALTAAVAAYKMDPTAMSPVPPTLDLILNSTTAINPAWFTRASIAWYFDSAGVLKSAANDTLRIDHSPITGALKGALIEESRVNGIRNNTMAGAVVAGAQPTNWGGFTGVVSGLTMSIVGLGVEDGIEYVDVRFQGTSAGTSMRLAFDTNSAIAAAQNEAWTHSVYCSLINGSLAGVSPTIEVRGTISGAGGSIIGANMAPVAGPLRTQRHVVTGTLPDVGTTHVHPTFRLGFPNATVLDFTLRIGLPQMEKGAFATSVIKTAGAAVTREADRLIANVTADQVNPLEGTIFVEATAAENMGGVDRVFVHLDDGSGSNRNYLYHNTGGTMRQQMLLAAATQSALVSGSVAAGAAFKAAMAWKKDDVALTVNGSSPVVDTSANVPTGLVNLRVGVTTSSNYLNGHIKRVTLFPKRIANATLQAMAA